MRTSTYFYLGLFLLFAPLVIDFITYEPIRFAAPSPPPLVDKPGNQLSSQEVTAIYQAKDIVRMEKLAREGNTHALRWIGRMLQNNGRHKEALQWYLKTQNYPAAENLYNRSLVPGGWDAVKKMYAECAAKEIVTCLFGYARILEDENPKQAHDLYLAAARQKASSAFLPLVGIYKEGRGVPRDIVAAYAFSELVKYHTHMDDSDTRGREQIEALQDNLKSALSRDQIKEAEKMAEKIYPGHAVAKHKIDRRDRKFTMFGVMLFGIFFILYAAITAAVNGIASQVKYEIDVIKNDKNT